MLLQISAFTLLLPAITPYFIESPTRGELRPLHEPEAAASQEGSRVASPDFLFQ
jgi:hypothetical protein